MKDPAAFEFFSNFTWTEEDQNEVALAIEEGTDPTEAAQAWIDENSDVVEGWLPAAS
jgi:glycine betaine/proline transport system substrate-binding protein